MDVNFGTKSSLTQNFQKIIFVILSLVLNMFYLDIVSGSVLSSVVPKPC